MGKKAKEHRKRVEKRNRRIKEAQQKLQKEYTKMMIQKLQERSLAMSGKTSDEAGIDITLGDSKIQAEIVEVKESEN